MHTFFFQAEDGIRVAHYGLEFRRVLFRSPAARDRDRRAGRCDSDWASGAVRASDLGRRPARPCRGPAQTCRRRGGASTAAASGRIPAVTRAVARLRQTADAGPQSPVALPSTASLSRAVSAAGTASARKSLAAWTPHLHCTLPSARSALPTPP